MLSSSENKYETKKTQQLVNSLSDSAVIKGNPQSLTSVTNSTIIQSTFQKCPSILKVSILTVCKTQTVLSTEHLTAIIDFNGRFKFLQNRLMTSMI